MMFPNLYALFTPTLQVSMANLLHLSHFIRKLQKLPEALSITRAPDVYDLSALSNERQLSLYESFDQRRYAIKEATPLINLM
jgi:hypothetical protein